MLLRLGHIVVVFIFNIILSFCYYKYNECKALLLLSSYFYYYSERLLEKSWCDVWLLLLFVWPSVLFLGIAHNLPLTFDLKVAVGCLFVGEARSHTHICSLKRVWSTWRSDRVCVSAVCVAGGLLSSSFRCSVLLMFPSMLGSRGRSYLILLTLSVLYAGKHTHKDLCRVCTRFTVWPSRSALWSFSWSRIRNILVSSESKVSWICRNRHIFDFLTEITKIMSSEGDGGRIHSSRLYLRKYRSPKCLQSAPLARVFGENPSTKSLIRHLEKNIKPTNNFSTSSTVSCQQNIDQQDRFNNTLSANIKHC